MNTKTRMPFHRKKAGKTNYKKRLKLLKSRQDRIVIRRTNKYLLVQIVRYEPSGDKVLLSVTSKELQKIGWKGSCKNLPASYLTGLLFGLKAIKNNLKKGILDMGLQTSIKGSRLYATLKGVVDAGLDVPVSKNVFPIKERLEGKHISAKIIKEFETIKAKIIK